MKRFLLIILACACILCLSACGETPETPETNAPETNAPETDAPETEAPETDAPETEAPETEAPETDAPETDAPETEAPETEAPETEAPETDAPETDAPETDAPETEAPETEAPETEAPETEAPETEAPETEAPETEAPETEAPETEAPETVANNVYVGGALSFEYPAGWEVTVEGTVTMLASPEDPTSNVNVVSEAKYDHATLMTEERYGALMSALYDGADFVIQDISIMNTTNGNGATITAIDVTATMHGIDLKIIQLIVSSNTKTYTISISDVRSNGVIYNLIFNSIAVSDDDSELEAPETDDSQVAGEFITIYVGDISVDYPKSWSLMMENMAQDSTTGNNINVTKEAKNTYYDTLDTATYIKDVVPFYETMGMTVTNVSVEHVTNSRGVDVVRIEMVMSYLGIDMGMTQFIVTCGDYTYSITLTEVVPDDGLADIIFNSITIK